MVTSSWVPEVEQMTALGHQAAEILNNSDMIRKRRLWPEARRTPVIMFSLRPSVFRVLL